MIASRGFPASTAPRREFGTHTNAGAHTGFFREAGNELQLTGFLDHHDNGAPNLAAEQRGFDVLLIFVAITDDQRLFIVEHRQDREQFWLRPRLQAMMIGGAKAYDLFDNSGFLIHLNGIHPTVDPLIAILLDRLLEGPIEFVDAAAQNI